MKKFICDSCGNYFDPEKGTTITVINNHLSKWCGSNEFNYCLECFKVIGGFLSSRKNSVV